MSIKTENTPITTTKDEAVETAQTIRSLIGAGPLMSLGAHGFGFTAKERGGLIFSAIVLPFTLKGARGTGPRRMHVEIILTAKDTFDVRVSWLRKFEIVEHYRESDVYGDRLARLMLSLDYDGEDVLNPRYI